MNKTELRLQRENQPEFQTYLQLLTYDDDNKVKDIDDIWFMDQSEMLAYVMDNLDLGQQLYGGVCDGEELSISTNVCYLPNDDSNTYVTMDDYYLLKEFDMLDKAAELVRSCKR